MNFYIKNCCLEKEETDCIIIGVFECYAFASVSDYLNQSVHDYINNFIKIGDIQGKIGQTLLLYNIPNMVCKRILLVGCGKKKCLSRNDFGKIIKYSLKMLDKISIKNIIFSFTDIEINVEDYNIYWFIRIIVGFINKYLYNNFQINPSFKKNIYLNSIVFHVVKKNYFDMANKALEHALAINSGILAAKKISNLPPNICNPFYLSLKAEKLSQIYQNQINVKSINMQEMYDLGMNAYIAVAKGSKNKPYMSVIKYCGENQTKKDKKVVVLIGKGVTFDSGGISIKPSKNMNEMKYDMCGAAAVYGTLIASAKLNLPLTIIGILAGCENMPGGNSFRPGDILTTMSGKTVEVLNTDAEGRLILCDVLTYAKRFSPDVVIDIATLTGACVVALGNYFSGLFSNNDKLAHALEISSKQTDDKVWRLPLSSEYEKELNSHFANFSNVGKSQAGAITAACFLSQFSKKYNWAHLDIAGTAWKSGKNAGATGRPVELLCQFLLNKSNLL